MLTIFEVSAGSDPRRYLAYCLCVVCGPWIIMIKNRIIILRETGGPLFSILTVFKCDAGIEFCANLARCFLYVVGSKQFILEE